VYVAELPGEGVDHVHSVVSMTLPWQVENLTLGGSSALNGRGNELANMITGNGGNNVLSGADGDDTIWGQAGADTLDGGAGHDLLIGGTGSDSYRFNRGYGIDTVQETSSKRGDVDRVLFGAGIAQSDTRYQRSGNALEVSLLGSADRLVLKDWYLGTAYRVEEFVYADGSLLTQAQVNQLVEAMAAFEPQGSVSETESPLLRASYWRDIAVTLPAA
jgi:trimeric autotransporter adhesin